MAAFIINVGILIISLGFICVDCGLSFSSNDNGPAMDFFRLSTKSPYRFHKQSLPEVLNFPRKKYSCKNKMLNNKMFI